MKSFPRIATALILATQAASAQAQSAVADSTAYQLGRLAGIALVIYVLWRVFRKRKS